MLGAACVVTPARSVTAEIIVQTWGDALGEVDPRIVESHRRHGSPLDLARAPAQRVLSTANVELAVGTPYEHELPDGATLIVTLEGTDERGYRRARLHVTAPGRPDPFGPTSWRFPEDGWFAFEVESSGAERVFVIVDLEDAPPGPR